MKERPILFSAPMVRALLDDRKTQSRRVVMPAPISQPRHPLVSFNHGVPEWSFGLADQTSRGLRWWRCPYGVPGDRLWVRERYCLDVGYDECPPADVPSFARVGYAATDKAQAWMGRDRPSIHMPRWASRILLEITDVRVERLQDISEGDAIAEGLEWIVPGIWSVAMSLPIVGDNPRAVYGALWDHINGEGAWAANPWVWAVSFKRIEAGQ